MRLQTEREANGWLVEYWSMDMWAIDQNLVADAPAVAIPGETKACVELASRIVSGLPRDGECLFVVLEHEVWPSSSLVDAFIRYRAKDAREVRSLSDYPGQIVSLSDEGVLRDLLFFNMRSGWDFLFADRDRRFMLMGSHDGFLEQVPESLLATGELTDGPSAIP